MEISQVAINISGQCISPALAPSIRSGPVAMMMFILFNHPDGVSANLISARVAAAGDGCQTFFTLAYQSCTKNTGRVK